MIWLLSEDPYLLPDPHTGEEDGLIAVGGDLSVKRLLFAYHNGFFPWYSYRLCDEIHWYCPLNRFVIFPSEIHISHSMRQLIRKQKYVFSFNKAFEQVIDGCAKTDGRDEEEGAWLGDHIKKAYTELHDKGWARSVEVWEKVDTEEGCESEAQKNPPTGMRLVGGLYGICVGNSFIGESMFSLVPSASKLALIYLAKMMEPHGGIIDCQLETPHLKSMGGRYISYEEYVEIIKRP